MIREYFSNNSGRGRSQTGPCKWFVCLVLLLFVAGCVTSPDEPRREDETIQPTPLPTTAVPLQPTYDVQRGKVVLQLEFAARIVPAVEEVLAFTIEGQVLAVYASRGDAVEAGMVLAELDKGVIEAERLQAQTDLAEAQAQLTAVQTQLDNELRRAEIQRDLAQLDLDFAREQAGDSPTPEQSYLISRRELELALAQLLVTELSTAVDPELVTAVALAEGRVADVEERLNHTQLVAPFSGELTSLSLSPGQTVQAFNRVGVLANTEQLEASATMIESEMSLLAEGMAATVAVANRPGEALAAEVRRLPFPYGNTTENTDVAESDPNVRIAFVDGAQAANFDLGDRVTVMIVVERHEDVLWLPPAAVREFNGRYFVIVQEGEIERRVDVSVGIEGNGRVEIRGGVQEGDTIIGP